MKSNTVVNSALWSKGGGLEKLHWGSIWLCSQNSTSYYGVCSIGKSVMQYALTIVVPGRIFLFITYRKKRIIFLSCERLLDTFAELRKATFGFFMSVCME